MDERDEEALERTQEAVEILRALMQGESKAWEPDLAIALSNLGLRLISLGRADEALERGAEALAIRRRLASTNPDTYLPQVAKSLCVLGWIQRHAGDHARSRITLGEGLRVLTPFYRQSPADYEGLFEELLDDLQATCAEGDLEVPGDLREWVARSS
jgi:tetratricopeptide (TPR) repeat protein